MSLHSIQTTQHTLFIFVRPARALAKAIDDGQRDVYCQHTQNTINIPQPRDCLVWSGGVTFTQCRRLQNSGYFLKTHLIAHFMVCLKTKAYSVKNESVFKSKMCYLHRLLIRMETWRDNCVLMVSRQNQVNWDNMLREVFRKTKVYVY